MLDTKLFKALRAGGLGHRAAALLAGDSRYGIGRLQPFDTLGDEQNIGLLLSGTVVAMAEGYSYIENDSTVLNSVLLPLIAGSALTMTHLASVNGENVAPDGSYHFNAVKLADANGIPAAPVAIARVADRSSGTVAAPSAASGWTFTASGGNLVATQATAGHYLVSGRFAKA